MKPPDSNLDSSLDPDLLPRAAESGEPMAPMPQPGYYPGYSTLGQQKFWDAATRQMVLKRVAEPPPLRFFSEEQARFWKTIFDHLLPQTDRTPERQIPLIPALDARLFENRTVGYRFEDMPPDRQVYTTVGIEAINQEAQEQFGGEFLSLSWARQDVVLRAIHDGEPRAAKYIWEKMSVHRFWQLIIQDAIDAYYAHPWAWDEIGYGGPAYPRAYTRLERGEPEPWEVEERRYQWRAPRAAVSDEVQDVSHIHIESEQHRHHPRRQR
ncbi:MAG: gluconate 2-dehydrogenase subunit 3 family protein [Acidobacteriota bacterium]